MQIGTPRVPQRSGGWRALLRRGSVRAGAVVVVMAALIAPAQQAPGPAPDKAVTNTAANSVPDKPTPTVPQEPQAKPAAIEPVLTESQKQAAQLLELATELKREVDKTDKDTLSVNVIRKAEMIEKLAKGVKQKMKGSGAS